MSPSAAQHWLTIQCTMLQGVSRGMLFRISDDSKDIHLEASWPRLAAAPEGLARKVLISANRDKACLEKIPGEENTTRGLRLFKPISLAGETPAQLVTVLEMSDRSSAERKTVAQLLRWNSEWLKFALSNSQQNENTELSNVFSMAMNCLDQEKFRDTGMALVTELAARFDCQRVSLGLRKHKHMEVQVLSHIARVKHETNLVQAIGAAMDEAADQDRVIVYPSRDAGSPIISHAHGELARLLSSGSVCSIPISEQGEIIGALTLERDSGRPLREAEIEQIEQLTAMIAPTLWLRHKEERGLPVKAWHSAQESIARLIGPAHIKLKLAALTAATLLIFFSLAQGNWRVTADAVVEGSVQRAIAAPIDGYIATVEARAGDVVAARQLLGSLDDSDLRLERLKWSTLRQQMVSESREAMAKQNRAEVSIINAKMNQADAELQLIDEQLSRAQLLAPFDGVVIEGDLSQLLGTPVSRGDILFKVAPLNDYRIVLKVDEQDIAPIEPGQSGMLILASMPERTLELRVEKVTPVSTPLDGHNFFRVEASLVNTDLPLQPGMEGVGKIAVGEANLFWIWTRDLSNWLRLQVWTWWR